MFLFALYAFPSHGNACAMFFSTMARRQRVQEIILKKRNNGRVLGSKDEKTKGEEMKRKPASPGPPRKSRLHKRRKDHTIGIAAKSRPQNEQGYIYP
jgi:hypothetical protein